MDKATKAKLKDDLAGRFEKATAAVVAEYRGLKVEDLTRLRVELRKAKAEFKVIKNRIARKAITDSVPDSAAITSSLKGPIGVVYCYGDAAQAAKACVEFEKENPNFVVKAALMDGQALKTSDLKVLADLPSRDVLMAKLLGTLLNPHRNLVGVLAAVPRDLVQVISAIRDKKSA